jgi:hypothetical protein
LDAEAEAVAEEAAVVSPPPPIGFETPKMLDAELLVLGADVPGACQENQLMVHVNYQMPMVREVWMLC